MASDEKQPPRPSGDRIEWFTVSYRTLALAGGAIVLLAAFGWFLFLRRTPPPPPPATAIETGARFAKIDGSVQVKRAGTLEWLPATLAVVLRQNDLVRTGSGAAAEIHFADGTVFNVRPDSLITIEESSQNPVSRQQRVALSIQSGRGQLPDRGAQRAGQHHDLDADGAHHRRARHRRQHPGGGGRRDRPAHLQGPGRGRDPYRPEDRARLERGRAGRRDRRRGPEAGAAHGPAAHGALQRDRHRLPGPHAGHHAPAVERGAGRLGLPRDGGLQPVLRATALRPAGHARDADGAARPRGGLVLLEGRGGRARTAPRGASRTCGVSRSPGRPRAPPRPRRSSSRPPS